MSPINHSVVAPHRNGIRPSGNQVLEVISAGDHGVDYIRLLPDEVIHHLFQLLGIVEILHLAHTCKRLYAFSLSEELWKDVYTGQDFHLPWKHSWRNSCLRLDPLLPSQTIQVPDVHSDLLFRPYLNSQIDLKQYLPTKRSNMVPRYDDLTLETFTRDHVHHPFILTKAIQSWPAMKLWTTERFLADHARTKFRAECVDWPLEQYVAYMRDNEDESPLYLFDSHFARKTRDPGTGLSLEDDYTVPACFEEDAFTILADDRPDHKWLIVGPARSGSTFHKDPNGTCAWNAVVTGSKLWIMFPPDLLPPGVFVSADESEVTSPLSIAEWLATYHRAARSTKGMVEAICGPGEVLYVPSGWWHLVVNLEECIAVTQNFVPRSYIGKVLRFLRDKRDQVSGFQKTVQAYELFESRLQSVYPEEWKAATEMRQSKWDSLRTAAASDSGLSPSTFAFAFSDESDVEECGA